MNNHKLVSRYVTHKINQHVQKDGNTLHTQSYVLGSLESKVALMLTTLEYKHLEAYRTAIEELMEGVN